MAIEIIEDSVTRMLSVKVSGKLSAEDYETLEPGVDRLIAEAGKIRILFVMNDFHGWDLGAVWEDIKFATRHCRDIEKVAMVGEHAWEGDRRLAASSRGPLPGVAFLGRRSPDPYQGRGVLAADPETETDPGRPGESAVAGAYVW